MLNLCIPTFANLDINTLMPLIMAIDYSSAVYSSSLMTSGLFPVAKCIDHYTKQRVENAELPEDEEKKSIDPRLEGIVNKMFLRCLGDHKYKQAIGIALETRRLDIFEKTILESVSGSLVVF